MKKILILLTVFLVGCGSTNIKEKEAKAVKNEKSNQITLTNTAHLDSLYEQISLEDGTKIGAIHIYSEYPDYKWIKDPIEGVACIDDVTRAGVFYFNYYKSTGAQNSLKKVKELAEFTLHLQDENGYFNNFIYSDGTVNTTYKTSIAEPNWWTWRAVWFLSHIYKDIETVDSDLAIRIKEALDRSVGVIKKDLKLDGEIEYENGIEIAGWLPNDGADQSSILILGLTNYYKITGDKEVAQMILRLGEGLMVMQVKDKKAETYGALLSWKNIWHAYGNSQAYALLTAGEAIGNRDMMLAGFQEIDNFHKYLIDSGFINWFSLKKEKGTYGFAEKDKFSQIAYGMRPLIYANLKAYEISRDETYIKQAVEISKWFFGNNSAAINMYDVKTGRTFDGIDNADKYNKNSGAESTIEGLLSILAIEQNKIAKETLMKYLEEKNK